MIFQYQTTRFRKAVDEIFPTVPFWGAGALLAVEYLGFEVGPGGVCYLVSPTAVYMERTHHRHHPDNGDHPILGKL